MTDAPRAYLYRYADPLTGRPVWRRDGELWNGQRPSETIPLYDQQALDAAREEGRRAGLEEAAKIARLWEMSPYRPEQPDPSYMSCEANIRALAQKEGE